MHRTYNNMRPEYNKNIKQAEIQRETISSESKKCIYEFAVNDRMS